MEGYSIEKAIPASARRADLTYRRDPNLGGYLYHLAMLISEWERDHQQSILLTNGRSSQVIPPTDKGDRCTIASRKARHKMRGVDQMRGVR